MKRLQFISCLIRWLLRVTGVSYLLLGGGLVYECLSDLYLYIQNETNTKDYGFLVRWSNRFTDGDVYLFITYFILVGIGFAGIGALEFYAAHKGTEKKYLYWPMLAVVALTCSFAAFIGLAIYFA